MRDTQIDAFLRIAETNSMTVAAEQLKISPAALSDRIKTLERALEKVVSSDDEKNESSKTKVRLFYKAGRGVELTEHGIIFLPFARIIEENWTRAKINIDLKRKFNSAIGIGIQFTLWDPIVPLLLKYMRDELSHVSPRFSAGKTDVIMEGLKNGQSEIVIAYEPVIDTNMEAEYLFDEYLIMASTDPSTVLENIRDELVFVDWGDKFHEYYWTAYRTYPHIQEPYAIFERTALALNVVRKSGGCGYFPYRFMMKDIYDGGLHPVKKSYVFTRKVYVVSRKDYSSMMRNMIQNDDDDRHFSGSGGRFNESNIENIIQNVKMIGGQQIKMNDDIHALIEKYSLKMFMSNS